MQLHEWRWTEGFAGGFGSAKFDLVEKRSDSDSIFEKLRALLISMPKWWLPSQFDWRKHDKKGNLYNPNMNSTIAGQGGLKIGRGGRRSMYVVDEAAALENPMEVDKSLSQNTNCQFDLSTPAGMNHFGKKRHSGKLPVFTFHWKKDPRKNKEWYDVQCKELDPVVVAQEIDINYQASVEGLFILPKWVNAAVEIELPGIGSKSAGLDVAAGGKNRSSLALKSGPKVITEEFNISNGIDLTHTAIEMCNRFGVEYMNYDEIGVGYAVESTVDRTEMYMGFLHFGLNAGDSPSDTYYHEFKKTGKEIFFNARSEWWYVTARKFERTWEHLNKIRVYDPEDMISIENNGNLISQLSSPKKMYTETGKIKCESKEFMLKRGIDSPDSADALVLSCQPQAGGNKRVMEDMDFLGNSSEKVKINWDQPSYKTKHYGAISIEKNLTMNAMYGVWDEEIEHLYIYGEYRSSHPNPSDLVNNMVASMNLGTTRVDKIIGNNTMFKDFKRTINKEINACFRNTVRGNQFIKLKEALRYDPMGSTAMLMNLIKTRSITIDVNCKEIKNQFFTWKLNNDNYEHVGMRECILLIISELHIYKAFKKVEYKPEKYSKHIPNPTILDAEPINHPMEV
jgi:hypothetical protein